MPNGFDKSHPYYSEQALKKLDERDLVTEAKLDVQLKQTEALTVLADGVRSISEFLQGGGLQAIVNAQTRGSIMQSILGGLASHDGRKALDAQTIKQNSLEIVEMIEQVFNKMHERLNDKGRDPEIKEPQE